MERSADPAHPRDVLPGVPQRTGLPVSAPVQLVTPPGSADEEETRLILSIAAGDRAALSLLYSRIGGPLMGYLMQLTSDYGLAEELLQDTLLAIWTSATTFAGRSRPRTWLFGVARRQAHNTLRRHGLPLA